MKVPLRSRHNPTIGIAGGIRDPQTQRTFVSRKKESQATDSQVAWLWKQDSFANQIRLIQLDFDWITKDHARSKHRIDPCGWAMVVLVGMRHQGQHLASSHCVRTGDVAGTSDSGRRPMTSFAACERLAEPPMPRAGRTFGCNIHRAKGDPWKSYVPKLESSHRDHPQKPGVIRWMWTRLPELRTGWRSKGFDGSFWRLGWMRMRFLVWCVHEWT